MKARFLRVMSDILAEPIRRKVVLLLAIYIATFAAMVSVEVWLNRLAATYERALDNQYARRTLGKVILEELLEIELNYNRLVHLTDPRQLDLIQHELQSSAHNIQSVLGVVRNGGQYENVMPANFYNMDEITERVSFFANKDEGYIQEVLELTPRLLDIESMSTKLLSSVKSCFGTRDEDERAASQVRTNMLLKQADTYLNRSRECANKIFYDTSLEVKRIEEEKAAGIRRLMLTRFAVAAAIAVGAVVLSILTIMQIGVIIKRRDEAESALARHQHQLEELVEERTDELAAANIQLQQEVAERKDAENVLRESEGKLAAMLGSIGDHMSMMDSDLNIVWANDVAKSIFGEDIIGKKCYEAYHGRNAPCEPHPCLALRAFQDGKVHEHDTQVTDRNGNVVYFHCVASVALRDSESKPTGVIEVSRNVTESKKAEQALIASEHRYRSLVENLPQKVFIKDTESRYASCNANYAKDLKVSPEQLIGRTDYDFFPQELADKYRADDKRVMASGKSEELDEAYFDQGEERVVHTMKTPVRDEQGNVVGVLGIFWDVTEKKRAEEALAAEKERLTVTLRSIGDGVITTDLESRIVLMNPVAEKLTRWSLEDAAGRPLSQVFRIFNHQTGAVCPSPVDEALETGAVVSLANDTILVARDGSAVAIADSAAPIRGADGQMIGVVLVFRDVTDAKKAEIDLKEASRIINRSPAVAFLWRNAEGWPVEFVSENVERLFGWTSEEFTSGKITYDKVVHPDDLGRVGTEVAGFSEDTNRGGFTHEPYRIVTREGQVKWVDDVTEIRRDAAGNITHYQGLLQDITERKLAEAALRDSETRYRALFQTSADGILIADVESRGFMYANPAVCAMLGYTAEELTRMKVDEIHPEDALEFMMSQFSAQASGSKRLAANSPCLRKDGTVVYADINTTLSSINGRECIVGFFRDMTERRALERQLSQAQKLESIGQLAAGIAHEINTPTQYVGDNVNFLRDASGGITRLLGEYDQLLAAAENGTVSPELTARVCEVAKEVDVDFLNDEIPAAIAQALEGIDRITKIVRAMKQFAHPGTDDKTAADINRAIENTITISRNEWKYVADIETELSPDLPLVPCLLGEFNQVILNMIVNAAHAIASLNGDRPEGKGKIRITTRLVDDSAEIRVSDTGSGIPESIRERVFDPFFTTKEVGKGTGQGLAIAHSVIVDKHSGTISVESEVGKGSTFIIRLPIAAERNSQCESSG